jgi:hypothetical protein
MALFDDMTPPLLDNAYRMAVATDVTLDGQPQSVPQTQNYFNVEGPRFALPAVEVAGVFPPRNGHGAFEESIPHIALRRRTLPWERPLGVSGTPTRGPNDPPAPNPMPPGSARPFGPPPWLALLLFEEGEYTLHQNVPLEQVVSPDVLANLGFQTPSGITCDSVEAQSGLIAALMPSLEELTLLSHVRWVNAEDRELSAGTDGWFSVVMSNRLPSPGAKCRACLVSVEQRADLVPVDPPPMAVPFINIIEGGIHPVFDQPPPEAAVAIGGRAPAELFVHGALSKVNLRTHFHLTEQLVLLYSWQFETTAGGTFRDLMQEVNVAMIGSVDQPGRQALTDTAHLRVELHDRAGEKETVWYRGPLVPYQLTRDPLGPYHSADQARRAAPESGAEDVSYAVAFETGRLLAAADARMAQELMRWRREAYRQSSRADTLAAVRARLPVELALDTHASVVPTVSASVVSRFATGVGPVVDAYGLEAIARAPGLDPNVLRDAWSLDSVERAAAILGGDPAALGASVDAPPRTARPDSTLEEVSADPAALNHLAASRDRLLTNAAERLGGQP